MGRRFDRLLDALDRLDERAGLNRGGARGRRIQRTKVHRMRLRFSRWLYRHPVRNAALLAAVSVAVNVLLALQSGGRLLPRVVLAAVPWLLVPLVAPAARRRLEEMGRQAPNDSGEG